MAAVLFVLLIAAVAYGFYTTLRYQRAEDNILTLTEYIQGLEQDDMRLLKRLQAEAKRQADIIIEQPQRRLP